MQNAKQVRKPWLYRRGGPCALPADQSSYSKEIFGEFVQSANSPNIFSRQYSVLPGGGEPLPYGGDWAMRLFCNSPFSMQTKLQDCVSTRMGGLGRGQGMPPSRSILKHGIPLQIEQSQGSPLINSGGWNSLSTFRIRQMVSQAERETAIPSSAEGS